MKNFKGFAPGLVLGLGLALSSISFAQSATQTDQKKETESCCAMASCCHGDSCSMKDHARKHDAKSQSSEQSCCCSGSDSCDINVKDKHKQG